MSPKTLSPEFFMAYLHKLEGNWKVHGPDWADNGYYLPTLSAVS
jgi:hypothetical protein